MSEWLLITANWAIFQLYHGENKLIFNEMMNMRDEGDSESEKYTSWFAVVFLFPTHYSTIPHERDVTYVFLYTQILWKHGLENWIFRHYWVSKLSKYHYKQGHIAVCP
jgi:hypothetical protein